MSTKKLNLFVEDPGSSNFAFNLEKLLEKQKIDIKIYASGISKSYLSTYKQSFIDYDLVKRIDYKCDFFIFGTSENKESPVKKIFKEAKKYNVKTGIIIDAPNSIFERLKSFEIDCYYENVDYFFVTDNKTKKELLKKKIIKANKILDVLNPKFQWIKDQKLQKKQKKKKKIIFLSELSSGLNKQNFLKCASYKIVGYSNSQLRTEIVFEELLIALKNFKGQFELTVRLHPKEKLEYYKSYRPSIDNFSIDENSFSALCQSDLAVGLTTNMLCEACLLNIPVLSITPRKKEFEWINSDFKPYVDNVNDKLQLQLYFKKFFEGKIKPKKIILNKQRFSDTIINLFSNIN